MIKLELDLDKSYFDGNILFLVDKNGQEYILEKPYLISMKYIGLDTETSEQMTIIENNKTWE